MKRLSKILLLCLLMFSLFQITAMAQEVEKLKIKSVVRVGSTYDLKETHDGRINTENWFEFGQGSERILIVTFTDDIEKISGFRIHGSSYRDVQIYVGKDNRYLTNLNQYENSNINVIDNNLIIYLENYSSTWAELYIKELEFLGTKKDVKPSLTLDEVGTVEGQKNFSTYVYINNAQDIYAEDIKIQYSQEYMSLENAEIVATSSQVVNFYHQEINNNNARFITVSEGWESALNTTSCILRLDFKAKNKDGVGRISIVNSKVANGEGVEFDVANHSIDVTVKAQDLGDVNQDGVVSLGDLAIAGRMYGTFDPNAGAYKPDINLDFRVDEYDLSTIVKTMLKKEKAAL